MDLSTIIWATAILLSGIFIPFYITDNYKLKKLKFKFSTNNFLDKLKQKLLDEIKRDKNLFLFTYVLVILTIIFLLLIQTSFHDSYYNSVLNSPNLINKTLEEKANIASDSAKPLNIFFNIFSLCFLIMILIIFVIYFYYRNGKHLRIEEATSKKTFLDLLKELKIKETERSFYIAIEKEFGQSRDEKIHKAFAEFIYNNIGGKA